MENAMATTPFHTPSSLAVMWWSSRKSGNMVMAPCSPVRETKLHGLTHGSTNIKDLSETRLSFCMRFFKNWWLELNSRHNPLIKEMKNVLSENEKSDNLSTGHVFTPRRTVSQSFLSLKFRQMWHKQKLSEKTSLLHRHRRVLRCCTIAGVRRPR